MFVCVRERERVNIYDKEREREGRPAVSEIRLPSILSSPRAMPSRVDRIGH